MTLPVFLHPELASVSPGSRVELAGDEGRHAVVVRRIVVGESICLVDGQGTRVIGTVIETAKATLVLSVSAISSVAGPRPLITVVQAIPKGDRAELAVEVLTEIGVDTIVPWMASRSIGAWRGDRAAKSLAKWRSTARESAKQSRRSWFPEITEQRSTAEIASLIVGSLALVLHEEESAPLPDTDTVDAADSITIIVGPEGGITTEELAVFIGAGAHPVGLGPTVLRTSTAGVVAVAALLSGSRRWGCRPL